MRRGLSDTERQRLVDVVAQATRDGLSKVSPAELEVGWEKLEHTLASGRYPSVPIVRGYVTPWYLRGIVFVSMILGVGITADWMRYQREMAPLAPLHFVLEGSSVGADPSGEQSGEQTGGQTILAPAHAPAELVFSDRSRVRLLPNAKIAVQAMDSHGARIALAGGELDVSVQRRQGSSWRFDAGPFSVAVKGTAFHLGFSAEGGRLSLQMREGVVEVTGPAKDRRFTLRAGESLELSAEQSVAEVAAPGKVALLAQPAVAHEVGDSASGRAATHRPRPRTPDPTEGSSAYRSRPARTEGSSFWGGGPGRTEGSSSWGGGPGRTEGSSSWGGGPGRTEGSSSGGGGPGRTGGSSSWGGMIARGEFAAVVKDAEARGLDRMFTEADAAELTALADAARYTRRYPLARQALLRVRERFAGTSRGRDAAFFLGRLAETDAPPATALDWYQTYLRESPRGPYVAEASGRQLALYARSDPARARAAARAYLDRYPMGSQAELARSLLPAHGD